MIRYILKNVCGLHFNFLRPKSPVCQNIWGVAMASTQSTVEKAKCEKANAEDKDTQLACKDEASVVRDAEILERDEAVGPTVGIVINFFPVEIVVTAVKRLNDKIRIALTRSNLDGMSEDEERILRSVEILVVHTAAIVNYPQINHLPNLKWIHSLPAGVDELMRKNSPDKPTPTYILTRNVGGFVRQMAEYVVTMIVARERHYREFWEKQPKKIWTPKMARPLHHLTIGIVGFGSIGKEVARMAKIFGLSVWALVRSLPTESTKCPDVDEYRLFADLGDLLSSSDYVISILPSTPSTDGYFDGDTLSKAKSRKPVFMNIGRGNVISCQTILRALSEGWISHAILDVFETEPLATESPLWTHPQVTVTPHISALGVTDEQFLRSFLVNYDRYTSGRDLLHTVDWKKGY